MMSDSVWLDELDSSDEVKSESELPTHADTIIVGCGMTGASLAYFLNQQGKECLVLDGRGVAGGGSGRNGGILWPAPECGFEMRTTQRMYDFIATLEGGGDSVLLDKKGGVSLVEVGEDTELSPRDGDLLPNVKQIDPVELLGAAPGFFQTGYFDVNPTVFWPARVVAGFMKSSPFTKYLKNCTVEKIEPTSSSESSSSHPRQTLLTSLGNITCHTVIVATNAWIPELLPELKDYIKTVSNTVLCSRNVIPESIRWPVCGVSSGHGAAEVYMNMRRDGRMIIGGLREREKVNSSVPTGLLDGDKVHDNDIAEALEQWFAEKFPAIHAAIDWEEAYRWKGMIAVCSDGMPVVGAFSSSDRTGVYVCGGLGGHGMPRCMGLASSLVSTICGIDDCEASYRSRCEVSRFGL